MSTDAELSGSRDPIGVAADAGRKTIVNYSGQNLKHSTL